MQRLWMVALVAGVVAGCTNDGPGAPATPTDAPGPPALESLSFGADDFAASREFAGSFGVLDGTTGAGAATGAFEQTFEITEDVPPGVPVRITAHLDFATSPWCQYSFWVAATDATWYGGSYEQTCDGADVDVTLTSFGQVSLVLDLYGPPASAPETPFSILLSTSFAHDEAPPQVPIGFAGGPGVRIVADTPIIIYGPDGALLARTDAWTLPGDAVQGEYALIAPDGPVAHVSTDGPDATMRSLRIRHESSHIETVPPTGSVTIVASSTQYPIAVGVGAFSDPGPIGNGPVVFLDGVAAAQGPTGPLVDGSLCSMCISVLGWMQSVISTSIGADGLVPGEYRFTVSATAAVPMMAYGSFAYIDHS